MRNIRKGPSTMLSICLMSAVYIYLFYGTYDVQNQQHFSRSLMEHIHKDQDGRPHLHEERRDVPFKILKKKPNSKTKYLLYRCESHCGGFGDRLRFVAMVYTLALKTGRRFGISEAGSCGFSTFFEPKAYNWNINKRELRSKSSRQCRVDKYMYKQNRAHTCLTKDVVYMSGQFAPINSDIIALLFEDLFQPKTDILKELDIFKERYVKNKKSVCAHVRIGKSTGFVDSRYTNLGNISSIWRFLSQYDNDDHVIFVASDSRDVKEQAKTLFPRRAIDILGPTIHIDKMKDDTSCSGLKKLLMDFFFLSKCDVLLLTYSTLGKNAAFLRKRDDKLFCFNNEEVYRCTPRELDWILSNKRTPTQDKPLYIS